MRPPERSSTPPLRLVVVLGIQIDLSEQPHDTLLFAPLDVLVERLRDGGLFRLQAAYATRLFNEPIVNRQVRRHVWYSTHTHVWRKAARKGFFASCSAVCSHPPIPSCRICSL